MKVIIIGGGAGGMPAASNIRKMDKNAEITVITKDNNISYSPCAIPYVLATTIESFDDIIMKTPEDYMAKNIEVLTESEVTSIDSKNKKVTYTSEGKEKTMDYDKLIIANGGTPFIPPMEGVGLEGVFKIKTIGDGEKVKEWSKNCKKAIVTGAGLIGIEIAYALNQIGIEVTLTEMVAQIVPRSLDPDMAKIVTQFLEMEGIKVLLGNPITKINGETKVESVEIDNETIETDMVILATGMKARLDLAKSAGCDLGNWAILVNDKMETSVEDIYAIGDCVESYSELTKSNTLSQLGTTAVRQARTVAQTITGRKSKFNPVLNSMVTKVGKLEFGAVGLTTSSAKQNNIKPVVEKVEALTRARYYPNTKPMDIKIICDEYS